MPYGYNYGDASRTFIEEHPINDFMSNKDRELAKTTANELSEMRDRLNEIYNLANDIAVMKDPSYLARIKNSDTKPSDISELTWLYTKYCLLSNRKDNPKLQKDCNMLLYAGAAVKRADESLYYAIQNIRVPLGYQPVTETGDVRYKPAGSSVFVSFTDKALYEKDKDMFPEVTDTLENNGMV